MKITPFRVVLALNLMVTATMDFIMISGPHQYDNGFQSLIFWGVVTGLQAGANLVLAMILAIVREIWRSAPRLEGLPQTFLMCAGLSLLFAVPVCFGVMQIAVAMPSLSLR